MEEDDLDRELSKVINEASEEIESDPIEADEVIRHSMEFEQEKMEDESDFVEPDDFVPSYKLNINHTEYDRAILKMSPRDGMAEIIVRDNHFITDGFSGELYCYINHGKDAGTYIEARRSIHLAVKEIAKLHDSGNFWAGKGKADEIYNWINNGLPMLEDPDTRHINVANGLIYLTPNGKLIDFSLEWTPSYLTTTKLPVSYDSNAQCPQWEKFIYEVFPLDSQHIAWEIMALLMIPLKNKAASGIILKGDKNTGKSTFQNGLLAFIGDKNTCTLAVEQFGERFQNSQLKGKLANVVGDLKAGKLGTRAVATIKQLVGNDKISGETKFGASYSFRSYARNLFSCNDMPTCDSDDAFFDRFLVIPFNRQQFNKDPIKEAQLNEALSSPEELSGLLNKALMALPKVIKEGIKATESMKLEHEKVVSDNDPICSLREHMEFGGEFTIACRDLHEYYKKLEPNDFNRKSNSNFGRALKKQFPELIRKQMFKKDGTRLTCYVGVKLLEQREEDLYLGESLGVQIEDIEYNENDPGLIEIGSTLTTPKE